MGRLVVVCPARAEYTMQADEYENGFIHTNIHIRASICMYTCLYTCICICIHIYKRHIQVLLYTL